MKNTGVLVWVLLLTAFAFGVGLLGGVAVDRVALTQIFPPPVPATGTTNTGSDGINFQLLNEAWNIVNNNYVDRSAVVPKQLEYGAVSGMVDALGDTGHTRFETPQMVQELAKQNQGTFEGIGAEVESKDGQTVIVAPIDGSPAQKAGLKAGDVIEQVNGQDVRGLPISDVVSRILGPAGTNVTLTILRPATGLTQTLTITRAKIVLQNVTWARIPGTDLADLRIAAFSNGIGNDTKAALQQIQAAGLKGVVLDLRNDPGGLLNEAVTAASQFLPSGNVLEVKDSKGNVSNIAVQRGGAGTNIPVIVLINQGTASAAEIVSGALQDYQRGKLIGETTFGTGTVLNEFPLSDGSALLLATEEWLTPKGRVIWHNGITPDIQVTLSPNVIPVVPEVLKSMSQDQLNRSQDDQLLKAIQVLASQP